MANGDVHDQVSDQYLAQFNRSIGISGMQKLSQFPALQQLGYNGQLGSIKNDFHGLSDFKSQLAKYSSVSATLRAAWALISAVVPNNVSIQRLLIVSPSLGSVGKMFSSIHNFGQVFGLSSKDLTSPTAVANKVALYKGQAQQASVVQTPRASVTSGGAGLTPQQNVDNTISGIPIIGTPQINSTLVYNGTSLVWTAPLSPGTSSGSVFSFSANIGDNSSTSITITHNLNTTNVAVQVHDNTTPFDVIEVDIQIASANAVTLIFAVAPTLNQYRCVVVG